MSAFDLRHLPVRRKILLSVGGISLLMSVLLAVAFWNAWQAQRRCDQIYHQYLLPTGDLTVARTSLLRALVLANNHLRAASPAEADRVEADMNAMDAKLEAAANRFSASLSSDVLRQVAPAYFAMAMEQVKVRRELVIPASRKGQVDKARQALREHIDAIDQRMGPLGAQLVKEMADQAASALAQGQAAFQRAMILGVGFAIAGLVGAACLALALARGISEPLADFGRTLGAVAEGDLTVRPGGLDRSDEFGVLGQRLDAMVARLRTVLGEVNLEAETVAGEAVQLASSSDQLAATSADIARASDVLRDGSERMSASVNELSTSIDAVNGDAQGSLALLREALAATDRGEEAGAATRAAMTDIASAAERIASVVGVIQDMANQTNLLSLNAAIEAAKAGEHGRGFSVVAEEVRKLAERSGSSAKEAANLIASARSAVAQGETTVADTVTTLEGIRTRLSGFADQTRAVAAATVEQASAGTDVARQVENASQQAVAVASAATQLSASTVEVTRTAQDLHRVSESLRQKVQHFRLA
ncbi:methyl-accepting chemotaxis protein [Mesoterricola sediminis]|uniref:Methyl-accepting chemotaxis protein n=1 Tax=Mesoterricola sediminis TaxID=2927980 RepID=A0AA48KCI7_9BACT|nr:methyl-accepting chemotaxis protein [Mesoterricola sediminis]BDU77121.1 methyl-accepting chemotaxis protein [Mesoterricola sediminis]